MTKRTLPGMTSVGGGGGGMKGGGLCQRKEMFYVTTH